MTGTAHAGDRGVKVSQLLGSWSKEAGVLRDPKGDEAPTRAHIDPREAWCTYNNWEIHRISFTYTSASLGSMIGPNMADPIKDYIRDSPSGIIGSLRPVSRGSVWGIGCIRHPWARAIR